METQFVSSEVRTELLYIIQMSFQASVSLSRDNGETRGKYNCSAPHARAFSE
jgi:hypothetical protein